MKSGTVAGALTSILLFSPPAFAEAGTLNLSHDLVDLQIASSNLAPNSPSTDASVLLVKGVEYAKTHGISRVVVDKGTYYFRSLQYRDRHVDLYRANDMTIDFQGSALVLANVQKLGIVLDQCTNTVLQNFTIDFQQPPFTQVRVTSVDAAQRQLNFQPLPGWLDPTNFNTPQNAYGLEEEVWMFIFRDGAPVRDIDRLKVQRPLSTDHLAIVDEGFPWTVVDVLRRIQPGDAAVLTARGAGEPVFVYRSDHVTLRNIRIYSSGTNGLSVTESANSLIERVYVMPKPDTDRLVSSNADGITLAQPGQNNTIRLCRSIRTLDDGFSPHSLLYGTVTSKVGSRTLMVKRQYTIQFPNGVPIVFQNPTDGAVRGAAVVVSQDPPPSQNPAFEEVVRITLDRDLADVVGTVLYSSDPQQRGTNTLVERNAVEDQVFARGMTLWGLMNTTVRANYVLNTPMSAIFGTHRVFPSDWMSPPLENLVIANNVVDGAITGFGQGILEKMAAIQLIAQRADFQPMDVSPHGNIEIRQNFVLRSSRSAIRMENVSGGSITDNVITNVNIHPFIDGYWEDTLSTYRSEFGQPVVVKTSQNIVLQNNLIDEPSTSPITVTDTRGQRLSAYAPGAFILLGARNIGALTSPAIELVDGDGMRHPVAVDATFGNAIRMTIPDPVALGGAVITLSAGNSTMRGTLFIDTNDNFPLRPVESQRRRAVAH